MAQTTLYAVRRAMARCALAVLGRDPEADHRLAALFPRWFATISDVPDSWLIGELWVRLAEVGPSAGGWLPDPAGFEAYLIGAGHGDRTDLLDRLRRAVARLSTRPAYVLTDGFPVDGLGAPGLAVWKGDRVAGCIAAASVIAKVTRDRMMADLHTAYPVYDFVTHKGYVTAAHTEALEQHGPCPVHRRRFVNVRRVEGGSPARPDDVLGENGLDDGPLGGAVTPRAMENA